MRHLLKTVPVLLLCLGFTSPAAAQELITDRPDQTESAATVPPGHVQVELGLTHSEDREGGAELELDKVGATLVRIGLAPRLELRLGWEGYLDATVTTAAGSFDFDGSGDGEVGVKYVLKEAGAAGLQIALLAGTSVPIGDEAVSSDAYDPSFRVLFDQELTDRVALGYNLGVEWSRQGEGEGEETVTAAVYSLALGFGLTERWGAFVEVFGEVPLADGDLDLDGSVSLNGGFTYLMRKNLQLDVAAGIGLTDEAPDWFVGVGVSFRLPG
jgi:hypothetical protein